MMHARTHFFSEATLAQMGRKNKGRGHGGHGRGFGGHGHHREDAREDLLVPQPRHGKNRVVSTMLWYMRHHLGLEDGEAVPLPYLQDGLLEHNVSGEDVELQLREGRRHDARGGDWFFNSIVFGETVWVAVIPKGQVSTAPPRPVQGFDFPHDDVPEEPAPRPHLPSSSSAAERPEAEPPPLTTPASSASAAASQWMSPFDEDTEDKVQSSKDGRGPKVEAKAERAPGNFWVGPVDKIPPRKVIKRDWDRGIDDEEREKTRQKNESKSPKADERQKKRSRTGGGCGKSKKERSSKASEWPSVSEGDPQAKQTVWHTQYVEEEPEMIAEVGAKEGPQPPAEAAEAEAPPPKIRDGKRYGLRAKAPAPAKAEEPPPRPKISDGKRYGLRAKAPAPAKAEEAPAPAPAPAPTTTGLKASTSSTHVHRPDAKPASAPRALAPGPGSTNTTSTSSHEVRNSSRRGAVAAAVQPVRQYPAGATPVVPPWRQPQMGSTMAMGVAAMATAPATVGTAPAEMPPAARIPMPKWLAPPEIPMPKFAAPHPEPQPEEVARAQVVTAEESHDWPERRLRVVSNHRIRMMAQSKDKAD
jgi:hypothetical protein